MIPPFLRGGCLTLAIAAISLGCGGNSQGTGAEGCMGGRGVSPVADQAGDGSTPCLLRAAYTSVEAVQLARCSSALPGSAWLISLASDGGGTLDSTGHDDHWTSTFWEPTSEIAYFVSVNPFGPELSQTPESLACDAPLDPLDSAAVVPDAVRRLGKPDVPLLMRQTLGCGLRRHPDSRSAVRSNFQAGPIYLRAL